MGYTPDPTDTTQPDDNTIAETAQAEFRALKAYIAGLAGLGGGMNLFRKNRVINGDFIIDQRNAGAVKAGITGLTTVMDRWSFQSAGGAGNISVQQKSDTPPAGYSRGYARITVTTIDAAPAAAASTAAIYKFEGYDVADFCFGTADAAVIKGSLSFWVRSSAAGVFCGSLSDGAAGRSYTFKFTINSANVWQQIKIENIPGDIVAGTYSKTNGIGLTLIICISAGANYQTATFNAWQAGNLFYSAAAVNLMATLNATFDIAGVQFERAAVASPFEFRSIAQELAFCRRYFCKTQRATTAPANGNNDYSGCLTSTVPVNPSEPGCVFTYGPMRTQPTITLYNPRAGGAAGQWTTSSADGANATVDNQAENYGHIRNGGIAIPGGATVCYFIQAVADAEL